MPDYDETDPYSCLAAGARELGIGGPSLEDKVRACFPKDRNELERLLQKDREGVLYALRTIWGKDHGRYYEHNVARARWAARELAQFGDPTLWEREQKDPTL